MKIKNILWVLFSIALIISCKNSTVNIENKQKGRLKARVKLVCIAEKKFALDSSSAPKPQYIQVYIDGSTGKRNFTFLNTYNYEIYFYNYETCGYIKKIGYNKQSIPMPVGYFIKNMDSIYIYNRKKNELLLTDSTGQILKSISLIDNRDPRNYNWVYSFPQYYPHTATPILERKGELIFPGQYMTGIPDSLVDKFKFTAHINLDNNRVSFTHRYPRALYGYSYNWEEEGLFSTIYYDFSAKDGQIVFSFPVSHDLYVSDLAAEKYKTVYGGSNEAGTISSINKNIKKEHISTEELLLKVCKTDLYGAIKYDRFRQVYYRFLRKGMPNATLETDWKEKPVSVIVFDKDFKYLGETVIGTLKSCNWENSFVTAEGLNIEFVNPNNKNEDILTLKIFTPKNLS